MPTIDETQADVAYAVRQLRKALENLPTTPHLAQIYVEAALAGLTPSPSPTEGGDDGD